MSEDLPQYYYRVRENGAFVYRVDTANRERRIEMDQIAVVNIKNGEIKAHGQRDLSDDDIAEISAWMYARKATLEQRDIEDIRRTIDHMNLTAHWAQSKASPEALALVTDELLLAMHDLRQVLVRKKADRVLGKPGKGKS